MKPMTTKLIAKIPVKIKADVSTVWDALTNPQVIKQYFFGTEAVSDWKVGSPLIFKGTWEGKTYEDKGTILAVEPNKLLRYSYWSSMSGKKDAPENYANVTYELAKENGATSLTIIQDNIDTEEGRKHSEQNWNMVLDNLKKIVEK
jgi:uncharacterized protein YndB with AHSA1/START domain